MLVTGGCGVPQHSDVVVDRAGEVGAVESGGGDAYLPPGPKAGQTRLEFVDAYLQAAAGDLDRAADRVREFLAPDARSAWQPGKEIVVIRRRDQPKITQAGANADVVVTADRIGVLTDHGTLEPIAPRTEELKFSIGPSSPDGSRFAILGAPPPGMFLDLMDGRALESWYQKTAIYFWSHNGRALVPDLRWMPKAIGAQQRPDILLGWLLDGPAPWLTRAVAEVPKDVDKIDNAVLEGDRVAVNLKVGDEKHLAPFLTQLRWTLSTDFAGAVRVQVNSKPHEAASTDPGYRAANLAAQLPTTPELYGVVGGVVRRLVLDERNVPPGVPALSSAVNTGVRYAAISRDRSRAALVRQESRGGLRLWVGSAGEGRTPVFRPTELTGDDIGRPVWPAGPNGPGFVVAGGELYQFRSADGTVRPVPLPGLAGKVTAVAASPDGQRLAVVVDGKLWTVALARDTTVTAASVRPVPTALGSLSGVAWLGETDLVISGLAGDRVGLRKVSIDGGYEDGIGGEQGSLKVTGLAAYPEQPSAPGGGQIFIEANDAAYQVFSTSLTEKLASDVAGPAPTSDPKAPKPIAPFFLD
jgi:hypothetical protein